MVITVGTYMNGTTHDARQFQLPDELAQAGGVGPTIATEITVRQLDSSLFMTIAYSGNVHRACDRCLKEYGVTVEGSVDCIFQHCSDEEDYSTKCDCYRYEELQDEIDIAQTIYDDLMLRLPQKSLCDEACEGLDAPVEEEEIPAEQEAVDPRWAALKKLKEKKY